MQHGIENPFQGTIATSDGECIWAFRYSSERKSRSLFFSTNVLTLRALYPENELLPARSSVPVPVLRKESGPLKSAMSAASLSVPLVTV